MMSNHCANSIASLRFGVTMAELHEMARTAVHSCGTFGSDTVHRYELAWTGIAIHLYSVEDRPTRAELIWAGRNAIYDSIRDYRRHNGVYKGDMAYGEFSSAAFWRYWWNSYWAVPSHENNVVERMALRQILAALAPVGREAIVALATFDTHENAATALGISYRAFTIRLMKARAEFRRLWHEGETSSRMWGSDQRSRRKREDA